MEKLIRTKQYIAWNEWYLPNWAIYFRPASGFRVAFRIGSHGFGLGWVWGKPFFQRFRVATGVNHAQGNR